MQIPSIRAFVFLPCWGMEQGVQTVDTASGWERKWLVGEITQRVHQPPSEETLAGCFNTSQEDTAAGKISPGHI